MGEGVVERAVDWVKDAGKAVLVESTRTVERTWRRHLYCILDMYGHHLVFYSDYISLSRSSLRLSGSCLLVLSPQCIRVKR